ncbi:MAG: alpha-hydroxy-acid oxidizing protein [Bacillota bacterium]
MDKEKARELMKGFCNVCNKCDGRSCEGEVPGMGGKGSGSSFKRNYDSLREYKLKMKVLHNVEEVDTSIEIFGNKIDLPVMAAPIGGVDFNMSEKISEKEYLNAVAKGCEKAGTILSIGDGARDYVLNAGIEMANKYSNEVYAFLKPWEEKVLRNKLQRLENETDIKTVGMDVDTIGLKTVSLMGGEIKTRNSKEIMEIVEDYPFNFIIKGIMTPEEARQAVDAGVDAIYVSNHGGRVLDHTPGVAEVLPKIREEVGKEVRIIADGGIRSGIDVLKMIALGADTVMMGRPVAIAAFSDLENGVFEYLKKIKEELASAMLLTGVANISEINSNILY